MLSSASKFRPMLASPVDFSKLTYPVLASPKLDGVRAINVNGKLLSRSLKPIPNKYLADLLGRPMLDGFDGELIVGDAWSSTVYRDTVSAVMRHEGQPAARFYVFDLWDAPYGYRERWHELQRLTEKLTGLPVDLLESALIEDRSQLDAFEEAAVGKGFEGLILRAPNAPYKCGRSTVNEGYLLKLKRFEDSEAVVIGVEEEMFNGNEAQTNELGRTKRSTAKDGLVGKGTMGALVVRDVKTGVEFNIGTGFTAEDRVWWWDTRLSRFMDAATNKPLTVKYKFFPVGVKDKPRHPVYLGLRPEGT